MNIKARMELSELIDFWSIKHRLSLEEEIEQLENQLDVSKKALIIINSEELKGEGKMNE